MTSKNQIKRKAIQKRERDALERRVKITQRKRRQRLREESMKELEHDNPYEPYGFPDLDPNAN